jgi:hypothetical protein
LEEKGSIRPELLVTDHRERYSQMGIVGLMSEVAFFVEVMHGVFPITEGCMRLVPTVETKSPRKRLEVPDVGMFDAEAKIGLFGEIPSTEIEIDRLVVLNEEIVEIKLRTERSEA